jgi:hypothetical protein
MTLSADLSRIRTDPAIFARLRSSDFNIRMISKAGTMT